MRSRLVSGLIGLIAMAVLAVAMPATGSAQALSEPQAQEVLEDAQTTFSGHGAPTDVTDDLRDLALALPSLQGEDARAARRILARPPDNDEPFGGGWPRPNRYEEEIVQTANYIVHYPVYDDCNVNQEGCDEPSLTDTAPANGVPDYVDATVVALEDSIAVENQELGWPLPKGDGNDGEYAGSNTDDRFDVYLADLCQSGGSCVFGFASPDDNSSQCQSPPYKCAAYLVLDNDYSEFGQSGGLLGLRVTTAHEYNHVLQFNIDTNQNGWMFESTATWAEEQVFPNDDDWVRSYMDTWASSSTDSLTANGGGGGLRIYGSAIWNHWIENGQGSYGPDVVLDAWLLSREVEPKDNAVASYDQAIKDEGGEGFYSEFVSFASGTAEWNTGAGNLPDAQEDSPGDEVLPQVQRRGNLKKNAKNPLKVTLDNTAYQLVTVDPRNANNLRLQVKAPKNVRWGLALVGRTGGRFDGDVLQQIKYAEQKRKANVKIAEAQTFKRITAVIVNADDGKNNKKFKASLK